jgi:hypothetical protein
VSLLVLLRDEAQAEFDEAFDYYEAQRLGLGVADAAPLAVAVALR